MQTCLVYFLHTRVTPSRCNRAVLSFCSWVAQVDLSLEAEHLRQFNLNFRKHAAVRFPVPIYPLVAPQVLVETFQEGESISRYRCCGHLPVSATLLCV